MLGCLAASAQGQSSRLSASNASSSNASSSKAYSVDGHLVWVLPFQNNSVQPGVDWIRASFPDIMNQRLTSAGFLTIGREDRRYALKHLGLPAGYHPTQATTYRIAQTLDADYLVFGNYTIANGAITATARVLTMRGPSMKPALEVKGNLDQLIVLENELAWKVAAQIDPSLHLEEQTFLAANRDLRLDAFEDYIRGEIEPGVEQQIGHLSKAVQLSPNYVQAWFALGKAYFANQQYEEAEAPFSKVPEGSRLWLEAMFYAGLGHLYTGNYGKAQAEFAAIAAVLPMPEVLNNEGIAINRRGQNGTSFFERVVQLDPQNPDYWFNLAVSDRRMKNYPAALKAVDRSLALRPQDEETQRLKKNLLVLQSGPPAVAAAAGAATQLGGAPNAAANPGALTVAPSPHRGKAAVIAVPSASVPVESVGAESASGAAGKTSAESSSDNDASSDKDASPDNDASPAYEPLERIARAYDESSFRQAAFEMEQMSAMKVRSMPAAARADLLNRRGTRYVGEGLLLEAERQFQLALAADPKSAAAHAGLAEVHEYVGSTADAKREASESVREKPNVLAYLVLARIALAERSYATAQKNVEMALQLEPNNSAARGVLQAIAAQRPKP